MAQTRTNPSASPVFPLRMAPRNVPAIARASWNVETNCQSFTDTTEQMSDLPLPGWQKSLVEPRRKQKPMYVLTYICVFVYTYMYVYTYRYVNTLSKIVTS